MDKTFEVYVLFGEYVIEREGTRQYVKEPLMANLSIAQIQLDWQYMNENRYWVPSNGTYLNCYFSPRSVELYPEG
jgi:hypothetical protein